MNEDRLLTPEQAREWLGGISDRSLRRHVAEGRLAAYHVGRLLRFKLADLNDYVERHRVDVANVGV